jgi:hypothetical protein
MRQYVGTILFAVLAIATGVIGWFVPSIHGSWLWSALVGTVAVGCLIAAYLLRPSREPSPPLRQTPHSAFIKGDADDSILQRVESNADDFISGNARRTFFGDVKHKSRGRR